MSSPSEEVPVTCTRPPLRGSRTVTLALPVTPVRWTTSRPAARTWTFSDSLRGASNFTSTRTPFRQPPGRSAMSRAAVVPRASAVAPAPRPTTGISRRAMRRTARDVTRRRRGRGDFSSLTLEQMSRSRTLFLADADDVVHPPGVDARREAEPSQIGGAVRKRVRVVDLERDRVDALDPARAAG